MKKYSELKMQNLERRLRVPCDKLAMHLQSRGFLQCTQSANQGNFLCFQLLLLAVLEKGPSGSKVLDYEIKH